MLGFLCLSKLFSSRSHNMHRSLRTVPFWSIAHSFWKSKGRSNGSSTLNEWKRFTTLNGYGRDSITESMQVQIVNALRLGERSRASSLLSNLVHINPSLRANDFVKILEYCAQSPDPLFVMETWRIMEKKEIYMSNKCHLLIIRALCKGGYIEEAFNLMSVFGETPDLYPILPMYNNLLGACAEMHSVYHAYKCLDLMEHGMVGKNEVTYTELLKIVLVYEDFNEALSLLNQGCSEGIQPDALLFNTVLQAACEKGRIDVIELLVEQMHQEKVLPDPSTCGYVFSAYVNGGFFSTALEALQVMSMRMISEDIILDEKRTVLEEDFIHAEDSEAESQVVELFKDSKEDLAVALLNLRWCAIVGNPISWLPNQSQWAKRLSTSYSSRQNAG